MFENFPYTDMHQLNLDWIIKIAKDFLDQYTHIQQLISDGEASLIEKTENGLSELDEKAENLTNLLNEWYNTHSEDIANELTRALSDINDYVANSITEFQTRAEAIAETVIEDIPLDYSSLQNQVTNIEKRINQIPYNKTKLYKFSDMEVFQDGYFMKPDGTLDEVPDHRVVCIDAENISEIVFTQHRTLLTQAILLIKDNNNVVKFVYMGDRNSLDELPHYIETPNGLPAGSKIFFNWFYANASGRENEVVDEVTITFKDINPDIVHGKNLFNHEKAIEGYAFYGTDDSLGGYQQVQANYCFNAFELDSNEAYFTVSGRSHIVVFDEYFNVLAKYLNSSTNPYTVQIPANAKIAIVSPSIASKAYFMVEYGQAKTNYEPYKKDFKPTNITNTDIHFTIPISNTYLHNTSRASTADRLYPVVDVNAVVKFPTNYKTVGKPTPVIMICHGSGYSVSTTDWNNGDNDFTALKNKFLDAGYAICDINGFDNTVPQRTWGSQRAIYAYYKLFDFIRKNYNVEDKCNVYGFSMGGLVALNFAYYFSNIVKSLTLASPVTALYDQVYHGSATWKESMAVSYGFVIPAGFTWTSGTPTTAEQELWDAYEFLTVGFDPYARRTANMDFPHIPTRVWHGMDDESVDYTFTQTLVNAIRATNRDVTLRLVPDAGHEICYGNNSMCNQEYVYWIDRFNN